MIKELWNGNPKLCRLESPPGIDYRHQQIADRV